METPMKMKNVLPVTWMLLALSSGYAQKLRLEQESPGGTEQHTGPKKKLPKL
jgi:hypothetical protein